MKFVDGKVQKVFATVKGVEEFHSLLYPPLPGRLVAVLLDCDKDDIQPGDVIRKRECPKKK